MAKHWLQKKLSPDDEMRIVAYLYGQDESQKVIERLINRGDEKVSRLRDEAISKNLLFEQTNWVCNVEPWFQRDYEFKYIECKLSRQILDRLVRDPQKSIEIHVIETGINYRGGKSEEEKEQLWERSAAEFGRRVVELPIIRELLREPTEDPSVWKDWRTIGICYSRVVRSFVDALAARELLIERPLKNRRSKKDEAIAFPLWPEPLAAPMQGSRFFPSETLSPTIMARDFSNIVNAIRYKPLSLQMMPAFDPSLDNPSEQEEYDAAKRLFRRLTAHDLIFGPQDDDPVSSQWDLSKGIEGGPQKVPDGLQPLVDNLDVVLLGVGSSEYSGNFWNGAFWEHGEIDRDLLKKAVEGDVGGCLLESEKCNETEESVCKAFLKELDDRWNGVKRRHLIDCAERAWKNNLPGVMAFVVGDRARVLLRAMEEGFLNFVAMDRVCAESLISLLPEPLNAKSPQTTKQKNNGEDEIEHDKQVKIVAFLRSRGWSKDKIMRQALHRDASEFGKLEEEAKKKKWLFERKKWVCKVDPWVQLEYEGMYTNQETLRKLILSETNIDPDKLPKEIRVIDTGVNLNLGKDEKEREQFWQRSAAEFGRRAIELPIIRELLFGASRNPPERDWRTLGICYSRVVRSFIDALAERESQVKNPLENKRDKETEAIVFPLWPEPLVPMQGSDLFPGEKLSPTIMARDFSSIVNKNRYIPLSLQMMPAFDPSLKGKREREDYAESKRLFRRLTAFDLIFKSKTEQRMENGEVLSQWDLRKEDEKDGEGEGSEESGEGGPQRVPHDLQPLVDHLDVVLLGIGDSKYSGNFWNGAFWEHGEIPRELLCEAVDGDVGGVLLKSDKNEDACNSLHKDLVRRWNGVKMKHLAACAKRSRDKNLPGVMAFVVGNRASVLLRAMGEGILNFVAMDRVCADNLVSLLTNSEEPSEAENP